MPLTNHFDLGPPFIPNNSPPTRELNCPFRRSPFRPQKLTASVESLLEADIPSPTLDHDPEIERLMSPSGSSRQSQQDVFSSPSTHRASSPNYFLEADRDSARSTYYEYYHDLTSEFDVPRPYDSYSPYNSYQADQPSGNQGLRPGSVLPAAKSEYHQNWYTDRNLYSASLHPPSSSLTSSTLCVSDRTNFSDRDNLSDGIKRNKSFTKRSVTPVALQSLREKFDKEVYEASRWPCEVQGDTLASSLLDAYEASRCSSETRPSTPASSLLPNLSFSSTATSPYSVMGSPSSQDISMSQTCGMVEHAEPKKQKKTRALPERLTLRHTQPRNISSPIPSPKYFDIHGATTTSYPRLAPSPSPAPPTAIEISMFDDSDDEEGKFSHHVKKIKSAVSLQNLHTKSRARTESSAHAPPMPSAPATGTERTEGGILQRSSNGSLRLRQSKESYKPPSPTLAPASFEAHFTSPVVRLQKKISIRRIRSNTTSSTSLAPSTPPNTPSSPTPRLAQMTKANRRQSRMSWYQCFSRVGAAETPIITSITPKKSSRRGSKTSIRSPSPSKVRIFFEKVFRLRK